MKNEFKFLVAMLIITAIATSFAGVGQAEEESDVVQDGVLFGHTETETEDSRPTFTVETISYGMGLNHLSRELYQDLQLDTTGTTNIDLAEEEWDSGNATALTASYGVILESSNSNIFTDIDVNEVGSEATAKTPSGKAVAEAESFGIYLDNSSGNIFEQVTLRGISSEAKARNNSEDEGGAEAKALAAGVYLENSSDNTFRYLDLRDFSAQASSSSNSGEEDLEARTFGVFVDSGSTENTFLHSVVSGNQVGVGIGTETTGISTHFSSIVGNEEHGVENLSGEVVDFGLNWWGSEDGPHYDGDGDGDPDYAGNGDEVFGEAIISPWLGADPDASEEKPGVQFISPLPILVKNIGPEPVTATNNRGYLNKAIWGSNLVDVRGRVIVDHGTYSLSEKILDGVTLLSECGSSCKTIIEDGDPARSGNEEILIESGEVRIGTRKDYSSRGFTINKNIRIADGSDASTVQLNWNNLHGEVINESQGRLDAQYNWWGTWNPAGSTQGRVDTHPFLPEEVCSFVDYMEKHEISNPHAAAAGKMVEDAGSTKKLVSYLIAHFNVKPREGEELIDEYGYQAVKEAFETSGNNYDAFLENLG